MDDYIYIILGVLWLAYTIYQSQRKLKQRQQKAAARDQKTPAIQEESVKSQKTKTLFDELFGEYTDPLKENIETLRDENVSTVSEKKQAIEATGEKRAKSVETFTRLGDAPESNSPLSKRYFSQHNLAASRIIEQTQMGDEDMMEEYDELLYDWDFDFDLKQAVIYSEILNRPYV